MGWLAEASLGRIVGNRRGPWRLTGAIDPAASANRIMSFRVELFSGKAGLYKLAPAWRLLTAQLKFKRHFHQVEWYLALAETFERHNMVPLRCFAIFIGDGLVAVFPYRPMRIKVGAISLRAMLLVSDQSEAQTARDFVRAPVLAESNFLEWFVEYMAQNHATWDVIALLGILEDSFAAAALKNSPQLSIIQTEGGAWGRIECISCGDGDRPFERLSKGFKQNLRTAHNKLNSEQVTFQTAWTESDLERLLPEFLKVESSGWKGELGTSALKDPATNTFLRQLISHLGPSGGCEIHLMQVNDETIAALFGIVMDNVWYIFRIGYDESYHRASPGHLVIENLLKHRATHKSFDVITPYNAPPWFHAWKPDRILQIFNAYLFRPSPEGIKLAKQIDAMKRSSPLVVSVKRE